MHAIDTGKRYVIFDVAMHLPILANRHKQARLTSCELVYRPEFLLQMGKATGKMYED
jgi:hypothetical protein